MEQNPYESPAPAGKPPAFIARLLLRIVAVCFWLVSLFLVIGIASNWNRPEIRARTEENPRLAAMIWLMGWVAPIIGFTVLGVASWRRSWAVACVGASAFLPLVAFVSY